MRRVSAASAKNTAPVVSSMGHTETRYGHTNGSTPLDTSWVSSTHETTTHPSASPTAVATNSTHAYSHAPRKRPMRYSDLRTFLVNTSIHEPFTKSCAAA